MRRTTGASAPGPSRSAHYAIGLPDAAVLARITGEWSRGLPGVEVTRVEGGAVPTPR